MPATRGHVLGRFGNITGGALAHVAMQNFRSHGGTVAAYNDTLKKLPISTLTKVLRFTGNRNGIKVFDNLDADVRTVTARIGDTTVFDRTYTRKHQTLNKLGVGAIALVAGVAMGSAAWRLGRLALGNLVKLNVGHALLQGGASAAIATFGPKLAGRAFGEYGDIATRYAGYGLIANTAWNVYGLLPGPQDIASFVSHYSTVRIARSPTGDEIVKKFIKDRGR